MGIEVKVFCDSCKKECPEHEYSSLEAKLELDKNHKTTTLRSHKIFCNACGTFKFAAIEAIMEATINDSGT